MEMLDTVNPLKRLTIDETLRQKILDFAYSNLKTDFSANTAGPGRWMCNISKKTEIPLSEEIKEFSKQCYNALGITEFDDEPMFGNFIGFNQEGAFVHPHTDPCQGTKWHVRLNFLIQKPESGGMPIIDDVVYEIEQAGCWLNIASLWLHGSTSVVGSKERIVLSLGALIEQSVVKKVILLNEEPSGINKAPNIREIFGTNVIIEHCPDRQLYAQEHIVNRLIEYVDQFSDITVPEQRGEAKSSCGRGEIANLGYLSPLLSWIGPVVWKNRYHLKGGTTASGMTIGRNWVNEMYKGCSGIVHKHNKPVAVFYVRIPPEGADMIFTDGYESIAAGAVEGDLLIHDSGISHSVSEHKSSVSRICLIIEFSFM